MPWGPLWCGRRQKFLATGGLLSLTLSYRLGDESRLHPGPLPPLPPAWRTLIILLKSQWSPQIHPPHCSWGRACLTTKMAFGSTQRKSCISVCASVLLAHVLESTYNFLVTKRKIIYGVVVRLSCFTHHHSFLQHSFLGLVSGKSLFLQKGKGHN